jgi:hypothetical protein
MELVQNEVRGSYNTHPIVTGAQSGIYSNSLLDGDFRLAELVNGHTSKADKQI